METENKYKEFIIDAVKNSKYGMCKQAKASIKKDLPELFTENLKDYDIVKIINYGYQYSTHGQIEEYIKGRMSWNLEYNTRKADFQEFEYAIILATVRCTQANIDIYIVKSTQRNNNYVSAFSAEGLEKM